MVKPVESNSSQMVQRVRVGMTGLAIIVLLIALASAVFRSASRETPIGATGEPKPVLTDNSADGNMADPAKEPLAEIGVTPSTTPDDGNSAAPASPPAAP